MRERKSLEPNTELRFTNRAGGDMHYVVGDVISMGGSCIVYDGYYLNNAGTRNTVRIKECFPYKLHITRDENGNLQVPETEDSKFQEYKERIQKSFDVANGLHQTSGLTNLTSNVFDRYEANNTIYIVSSYVEGSSLLDIEFETLRDAIRVVISTARSIGKIHDKGYLYLDVKPENILMYKETPDLIQLFDFDSVIPIDTKENITEYKISYSMGFAPVEQKTGKMSLIGKYTDIYSVGALLFYLLFKRAPKATDCGFDVTYDYSKIKWDTLYQGKVYKELTLFFHNTLQAYHMDRYQTMEEAIEQLQLVEKYADLPVPFICSGYVANSGIVIGREQECNKLWNWYSNDERLLFVTGMGGIGKSTIVRKFASDYKEQFDNLLYLQYQDSIYETITDDTQFCISGYEKEEEETTKEYFARKIKAAKELTVDTNTLLIIDNFEGAVDESLTELLSVNWKIIVITRSDMSCSGYAYQKIEKLHDKRELYALFESNMERRIRAEEYRKLDCIIEMVAGHTLALVLIARQIAKSFLDVDTAMRLVENNGFSGIAQEKVKYMQDGKEYYDRISAIIKAVYDVSILSGDKQKCLKILSLFDIPGIDIKEAKSLLKLESLDDINELVDLGWLEISGNDVQMHPLIQETIHQIEWTEEYREIATVEMQMLFHEIKRKDKQEEADYKRRRKALVLAKSVLLHSGKDSVLCSKDIYKNLMFVTLMKLPREQEDYIIHNCEKLLQDNTYGEPYSIMELYDYVVYLQCEKADYKEAIRYLERANLFAESRKEHYIWGLYYDMLLDYYEELLNGAYCTDDEDEIALLVMMLEAMDKAIHHMRKAKHDNAQKLYAKYMLGKACLMIRSMPEQSKKIRRLILKTKRIVEQQNQGYEEVCSTYYMALAWYYTLCKPEKRKVLLFLEQAVHINEGRNISELDNIDYFYIPAANMMCEFGDDERTLKLLDEAYNICEEHGDSIPYIRKKRDLLEYRNEIE